MITASDDVLFLDLNSEHICMIFLFRVLYILMLYIFVYVLPLRISRKHLKSDVVYKLHDNFLEPLNPSNSKQQFFMHCIATPKLLSLMFCYSYSQ